jgi:hypothetical protein
MEQKPEEARSQEEKKESSLKSQEGTQDGYALEMVMNCAGLVILVKWTFCD